MSIGVSVKVPCYIAVGGKILCYIGVSAEVPCYNDDRVPYKVPYYIGGQ